MNPKHSYVTNLDIKFKHLEKIDIPSLVKACTDKWFNQTLTNVNGSVVRLGIVEGEYHWHKHDNDDEFFFVLEGKLLIDLEVDPGSSNISLSGPGTARRHSRTIELGPQQGVTIPKGVMHCPRAPVKTVMLMVETADIKPTGD